MEISKKWRSEIVKEFSFNIFIDIEMQAGVKVYAEVSVGIYFVGVYAGIEGTILECKLGFKFHITPFEDKLEFSINLSILAVQFRIYTEARVNLIIYKDKDVIYEYIFGLKEPVLDMKAYWRWTLDGKLQERRDYIDTVLKGYL